MEIFYSQDCTEGFCELTGDEAAHCAKVLRHKPGDTVNVIDGEGTMYTCTIVECSPKRVLASVESAQEGYGSHSYHLTIAVAPPKNIERYEWFVEKATEIGLDEIYPVIGDFSERKVLKTERLERIILSATKQSLKASLPHIHQPMSVMDFIGESRSFPEDCAKVICYCDNIDGSPKRLISDLLRGQSRAAVLIGPEGDFSRAEVEAAVAAGWKIASLGTSRLRIETAALTAVGVVYFLNSQG